MILKNSIKESTNKIFKGFTLIELLIGAIIASIASIAIIYAVIYVQTRTYELEVKDHAYEELKSYTEFWKGKIAASDISTGGSLSDMKNICLIKDDDGACLHDAILSSNIILIGPPGSNAQRHGLKTKIEWENRSGINQEIEFYIEQMEF